MRRDTRTGIVGLSVAFGMLFLIALEVWLVQQTGVEQWARGSGLRATLAVLGGVLLIPANAVLWWWLTKTIARRFDA